MQLDRRSDLFTGAIRNFIWEVFSSRAAKLAYLTGSFYLSVVLLLKHFITNVHHGVCDHMNSEIEAWFMLLRWMDAVATA